jgi:mannose-6-phosphate isomerase-like protein (cupin superfamily)
MKLHKKFDHILSGIHYWGKREDVNLRINFGDFDSETEFPIDTLHYHKTRTTYFCVLSGSLFVEIEGEKIIVNKEKMLEVQPMEKYITLGTGKDGCKFIVIGSHNEDDKIAV